VLRGGFPGGFFWEPTLAFSAGMAAVTDGEDTPLADIEEA